MTRSLCTPRVIQTELANYGSPQTPNRDSSRILLLDNSRIGSNDVSLFQNDLSTSQVWKSRIQFIRVICHSPNKAAEAQTNLPRTPLRSAVPPLDFNLSWFTQSITSRGQTLCQETPGESISTCTSADHTERIMGTGNTESPERRQVIIQRETGGQRGLSWRHINVAR